MTAAAVAPRSGLHAVRGPYQGLMPYTEDRHRFFFGRDRDIALIASNARAYRFCLLYGLSGVGKSSVLQAGVVRSIRDETTVRRTHFDDEPVETVVAYLKDWRDDPLPALWAAVLSGFRHEGLPAPADAPVPSDIGTAIAAVCDAHDVDLVMILDQFEEFFLYHSADVPDFARLVAELTGPRTRGNVLIAMREDALSRLDEFEGIVPGVFDHTLRLEHLDEVSARAAVVEPLRTYNEEAPEAEQREIEPALVDRLLTEVRAGQVQVDSTQEPAAGAAEAAARTVRGPVRIEAPFLQLVLTRLWDEEGQLGSRVLRLATLEGLGGAQAIVSQHLDRVMAAFTEAEQVVLTDAFGHLVTPSGSKIAHRPSDLAVFSKQDPAVVNALLRRLAEGDQRILREVPPPLDEPQAEPRYEIFHDVLALAVLAWRRRRVADAEVRETRRRLRRVSGLAAVMALMLVVCLVLAFVAWRVQVGSAANEKEAELSRKLVEFNRSLSGDPSGALDKAMDFDFDSESDPDGGYQEAFRRAFDAADTDVVMQLHSPVVYAGFAGSDSDAVVAATEDGHVRIWDVESRDPVRLDPEPAYDVVVTDGGRLQQAGVAGEYLVVLTDAFTVFAVNVGTGDVRPLDHQLGEGASLSFSPRGQSPRMAAWDFAGDIVVWDVGTDARIELPNWRYNRLDSASLDESGGTLLVTSGLTADVWDLNEGRRTLSRQFTSHVDPEVVLSMGALQIVRAVLTDRRNFAVVMGVGNLTEASYWNLKTDEVTPLGSNYTWRSVRDVADVVLSDQHLLAVAGDKGVTFFDNGGGFITQTPNENDWVNEIETSPVDPADFVVATNEGASSLYRLNMYPPQPVWTYRGQTAPVTGLSFSEDGADFVTGSTDGSVRVWRQPESISDWYIPDWIFGAEFTPSGDHLFGFTSYGRVVRMDRDFELVGQWAPISGLATGLAPAPDGSEVAMIESYCEPPLLVGMDGEERPTLGFGGETSCTNAVAWNPDSDRSQLVGGTYQGTLMSWDPSTGAFVDSVELGEGTSEVHDVAFSGDGSLLAAATSSGKSGRVHLVDAETLEVEESWPAEVDFLDVSRNGDYVVTVSNARHEVVVWDDEGTELQTFKPAVGTLSRVTISPDESGSRIALTTSSGSIYVWSRESGRLLALLHGHSDAANQAAFDPEDIDRIVSAGDDGFSVSHDCEVCGLDADELKDAAEDRLAQQVDTEG